MTSNHHAGSCSEPLDLPLQVDSPSTCTGTNYPNVSRHTSGVWLSAQTVSPTWLVLFRRREGRVVMSPPPGSKHNRHTRNEPSNPQRPTLDSREEGRQPKKARRHNGQLSLPIAAGPDNYCTHMQETSDATAAAKGGCSARGIDFRISYLNRCPNSHQSLTHADILYHLA